MASVNKPFPVFQYGEIIEKKNKPSLHPRAKRMNEGKIAKDASQQESFRYVNCELTVKPEITALQTNDGTIVEDNGEIVEVQFDFFSTVYASHKGQQNARKERNDHSWIMLQS